MRVMASQTGIMRGMTETSCLPPIAILRGFSEMSIVFCSLRIEAMGLQLTRMMISSPVVIPARIPPAWLVRKPFGPIGRSL